MHFPLLPSSILVALALHSGLTSAADDKVVEPCTVQSSSGAFYDLRTLSVLPVPEGKKPKKTDRTEDYHARGYDIPYNFTLNICAPLLGKQDDLVGISKKLSHNASAFYEKGDEKFSIGQQSSNLTIRGKRLVLQYTNGSPCGQSSKRDFRSDDDDDDKKKGKKEGSGRKSTIISFHCDKDPLASAPSVSFVGVDPDECAYSFEVLSKDACIGSAPAAKGVGPGAVFAIIGVIAILVYFLGGVFYQRNVSHARGWRQLPNYSMWAGIGSFIKDMFIIATSSCSSCLPTHRGYSSLSISANDRSPGRGHGPEDENRLIDQLDEEWDD
ncbi:Mannose 6-phosphate receptor [Glarea lozoyensis ATCC 20868]|uniref:Autophagy-related protein 27 n=1 Tax=Glarea lozoyensis (strain ATCC 20868 / MF5171) TaxID=1116229 RepID=S3D1N3_GLAL2|nr:Mannose 6-phosphate receptor [Glarea lozoyensis ATCC 20868]EPE32457.1 Mannose 6-phosphate receptor [Glarea lozoyensis ATCC 20868]